jgi:hypothetical protein
MSERGPGLQLLCIGDVALADEDLSQRVWMPPGGVIPGDDVRVLFNWELPIGDTINPAPRSSGPRLLALPDSPRVIQRWLPGFATLATNHILDAGEEGLINTIGSLNRAGFTTVGAGRTQEEITRALSWETAEGRLAMVNWVFPETHPDWMSVPGPNCWPGLEGAERTIQKLKSKTDWVLIVVHWSDENFPYPRPEDRVMGRELARIGADLVVGHHPHVVRGMEIIGSCPVFYSIGNFYFSDIADGRGGWITRQAPRHREGLGVQVSFRRGKRPEYQILSFWQTRGQVVLDSTRRAVRRMEMVSRPLQRFQNSGYAEWYSVQRARFDRWDYRWHFGLWRLGIRGLVRHLLQLFHSHF